MRKHIKSLISSVKKDVLVPDHPRIDVDIDSALVIHGAPLQPRFSKAQIARAFNGLPVPNHYLVPLCLADSPGISCLFAWWSAEVGHPDIVQNTIEHICGVTGSRIVADRHVAEVECFNREEGIWHIVETNGIMYREKISPNCSRLSFSIFCFL